MTSGPIVIHGKVIVGMTNCDAHPVTSTVLCAAITFVYKRDWKFEMVALDSQPDGDTWDGLFDDMRQGAETGIVGTHGPEINTPY